MKILITGGNGQLAYDCTEILKKNHEVFSFSSKELNIANIEQVEESLKSIMPDVVLNCAAFTKVDACEREKELARKVNTEGPKNLAQCIERIGSKLIHISTDYVFNGKKKIPEPYAENDNPDPVSCYGKTKLGGEREIQKNTDRYAIVRTAWLYSIHGKNFLKTMLKLALNNPLKEIKVVNDQFGSPTWSFRLAKQIEKIIEINGQGIYHATSEGCCTWFEVAEYFFQKMQIPYKITPCSSKEYPTPAIRPANSILENQRLKKDGIDLMPHWQSDIDRFVLTFREQLIKEASEDRL